jgi:hypothetical protein
MRKSRKGLIRYLSKYYYFSDCLAHLVDIFPCLSEDSDREHIYLLYIQKVLFTQIGLIVLIRYAEFSKVFPDKTTPRLS